MRGRAAAGFTLLEILVVMTVLGFLLIGLSQTVRVGLAAWSQDARLSENKADLDAVDRSLRSIVENLAPGDDSARPPISGSADAVTGVSRIRVPGSGVMPIPVEAGLAVSGNRLVLRWRPYHHGTPVRGVPPPTETDLVGNVARLDIGYWQAPGVWVTRWHEPDLPLLVRFRVTFLGEHPPRWPDIVVAPRLSRP